ncbi:CLUMA_CG012437, isoform A [Clunio marinus]|uniref:CLUMA_CG012437, isoform A n=1 Tax=Clunio marinus TaxID=568069 RepID=A0A1J1IGH0_9DIPT|nr:CLUMA_CG012437, isoform A [Clunio marinus]
MESFREWSKHQNLYFLITSEAIRTQLENVIYHFGNCTLLIKLLEGFSLHRYLEAHYVRSQTNLDEE